MPVFQPDAILFDKVLRSLTAQSLKEWELVAVIDGSFPEAVAAVNRAMKKVPNHYKIIELEHGGVQKARNIGFHNSIGDYVVFWDSDCLIECHTAKNWVDILDTKKEYGFVYSGYKFLDEGGGINSEPFDPFLLRVRNYISTCFPLRRELFPGWDENLESLQDWSFWLSIVENGAVGKFVPGYAFSTAAPSADSISGKGCTQEKWLERMDRVKALHNIPIREVCIASLHNRLDAIATAKAIGADYQDCPNDKPNHYKKIIQIGFSVRPDDFERCARMWGKQHEKVIFWTAEDIEGIYDTVSLRALEAYASRINLLGKQYVETKQSQEIMEKAGFNTQVLPLPVISTEKTDPLPDAPKFLVDVSKDYGHVFTALEKSVPDIKLKIMGTVEKIEDYTGMICFHKDRLLRPSIKRMLSAGRHVVSNVQQPFCGYMDDRVSDAVFIRNFVGHIRAAAKKPQSKEAVRYWIDPRRLDRFKEAIL